MDDIYSSVRVSNFQFTSRATPFDWRLLHGVDVDEVVSTAAAAGAAAAVRK
jgi:hypothetical protein